MLAVDELSQTHRLALHNCREIGIRMVSAAVWKHCESVAQTLQRSWTAVEKGWIFAFWSTVPFPWCAAYALTQPVARLSKPAVMYACVSLKTLLDRVAVMQMLA